MNVPPRAWSHTYTDGHRPSNQTSEARVIVTWGAQGLREAGLIRYGGGQWTVLVHRGWRDTHQGSSGSPPRIAPTGTFDARGGQEMGGCPDPGVVIWGKTSGFCK